MLSWNSPSSTAPSPKKQAVTRLRALHLVAERDADRQWQTAADDRVAAIEAGGAVEDVHRAAATAAAAFLLAQHLGHQPVHRDAAGDAPGRARDRSRRRRPRLQAPP